MDALDEFLDDLAVDRLIELCRRVSPMIKPWRDESGKEWYLISCAPDSPGDRWVQSNPERVASLQRVSTELGDFILLDPEMVWAEVADK